MSELITRKITQFDQSNFPSTGALVLIADSGTNYKASLASLLNINGAATGIQVGNFSPFFTTNETYGTGIVSISFSPINAGNNRIYIFNNTSGIASAATIDPTLFYNPISDTLSVSGVPTGFKADIRVINGFNNWMVETGAISFSKFQNVTGNVIIGRSFGGVGPLGVIQGGTGIQISGGFIHATGYVSQVLSGALSPFFTLNFSDPTSTPIPLFSGIDPGYNSIWMWDDGANQPVHARLGTGLQLTGGFLNVSSSGYSFIEWSGVTYPKEPKIEFLGSVSVIADNPGVSTRVIYNAHCNALAQIATNGLYAITANGVSATRTIGTGISAGISITNGDGVAADPTISVNIPNLVEDTSPSLANDFILTYDASATQNRKVKLQNLPFSSSSASLTGDLISFETGSGDFNMVAAYDEVNFGGVNPYEFRTTPLSPGTYILTASTVVEPQPLVPAAGNTFRIKLYNNLDSVDVTGSVREFINAIGTTQVTIRAKIITPLGTNQISVYAEDTDGTAKVSVDESSLDWLKIS